MGAGWRDGHDELATLRGQENGGDGLVGISRAQNDAVIGRRASQAHDEVIGWHASQRRHDGCDGLASVVCAACGRDGIGPHVLGRGF